MKQVARLLSLVILVSAGLFYASCDGGGESGKSEEETQLDKLKGNWSLVSANDGTDRTDFVGLKLNITGTYAASGTYNYSFTATSWPSVSPWPASGSWKFKDGKIANTFIRLNDNQEIAYALSSNDTQLVLSFNYQGTGFNNRVNSVTGNWQFTFQKQ